MGYTVINKNNVYKITQATDSLSRFKDIREVYDYISKDMHYLGCTLDFDNEKTAKVALDYFKNNLARYEKFNLDTPEYWSCFSAQAFEEDIDERAIYANYYKFYAYLDKSQNIAALRTLLVHTSSPFVGKVIDISKEGDPKTVKVEINGEIVDMFVSMEGNNTPDYYKYELELAKNVYLYIDDIDRGLVSLPQRLGEHYGHLSKVEGNKAIYAECDVKDYYDYRDFFEGLGQPYEIGWEAVGEAWRDYGMEKAVDMLTRQLCRDFCDDVLSHVEIYEGYYNDGFSFDDGDMWVDLAFDKDWLIEWCLEGYM